ncbi:muconate cycloisomerase [Ranunculus cassubicifolius]
MLKVLEFEEIKQKRKAIREILQSIDEGNLSVSAYDTAWVALVKDIHGNDAPQFQSSLDWIVNNQLSDGSWGDHDFFSAYDRLSCTLACVVALTTWNIHPEKSEKGVSFLRQNLHRLKDEDPEHMPSGFEVRFPSLIEMAQNLGLEISEDSEVLQDLNTTRALKLKRIPKEMLHSVSTTLLYSLEGMPDLNWEKLLNLQHPNVPHCYPIDLFERLWVVDRLERLGISRNFKSEIKNCLDYVYRHWTPNGISWSRDTVELDIDDTSMGFRMLRSHGYDVEARGQFFCFLGQMSQGVTEMLSLYRASQVRFPGEKILEEANKFSSKFLKEKQDLGQVADRWLITKDLVGEVRYCLDVPRYASLPRLETRYYIDLYGGDDDVWIGKVLYRMHNVSRNLYLELAKLDYNHCQKLHQLEWIEILRWTTQTYFLAMSNIFEPDRATERLAWTQTTALIEVVSNYFKATSVEQKRAFIQHFTSDANQNIYSGQLGEILLKTLTGISTRWNAWLLNWENQEDKHIVPNDEAELIVYTINLCSGYSHSVDLKSQTEFAHLTNLTNEICNQLHQTRISNVGKGTNSRGQELVNNLASKSVEQKMEELVQQVLQGNTGINREIKRMFLVVAKSYYYTAYYEPATIDLHISKVLFDRVI